MVVDKAVAGTYKLQNVVPFEIQFTTCVHGREQRVALSIFECIRTPFNLALTTFTVAFVSTTVSPLNGIHSPSHTEVLLHPADHMQEPTSYKADDTRNR